MVPQDSRLISSTSAGMRTRVANFTPQIIYFTGTVHWVETKIRPFLNTDKIIYSFVYEKYVNISQQCRKHKIKS